MSIIDERLRAGKSRETGLVLFDLQFDCALVGRSVEQRDELDASVTTEATAEIRSLYHLSPFVEFLN